MAERLQKLLAEAGVSSRRGADRLIEQKRVSVNGKVAEPGQKAEPEDRIEVDGKRIRLARSGGAPKVLMYHKPVGQLVTRDDPEKRDTVFEHLPRRRQGRWIAVGRLDINTCGLLLLTDHGELASRLMHPRYGLEREYAVRVLGEATDRHLQNLLNGVELEDGIARFDSLQEQKTEAANRWFRVRVSEGRNRLVRRLWESQGFRVNRLIRTRYGPIELPRDLRPGKYRDVDEAGVAALFESVALPRPATA